MLLRLTHHGIKLHPSLIQAHSEKFSMPHKPELPKNGEQIRNSGVTPKEIPVPDEVLNIINKTRSNPLPWRGQFSPQLVEALLQKYAPPDAVVLDPFVGSGTVLYECARLGVIGLGSEINPAAATLARCYQFTTLSDWNREKIVKHLANKLGPLIHTDTPQCSGWKTNSKDIRPALIELRNTVRNPHERNIIEALICISDFYQGAISLYRARSALQKLSKLVLSLPYSCKPVEVALCDARTLPLPDACVDIVITSPPYINVFNYHQQYRASMEALGWNLLQVARSEIGSNRKHRANRLLTVIQYCIDMAFVLAELRRVVKNTARLVLVVGRESNVRNVPFNNGRIVERLVVESMRFKMVLKQERGFKNKFGQHIYEDVLHLVPSGEGNASLNETIARRIALEVLREAAGRASKDVLDDFRDAMDQAVYVKSSPLFSAKSVNNKLFIPTRFVSFDNSHAR